MKLPRRRVDELVTAGAGHNVDPRHDRLMRAWFELAPGGALDWQAVASQARCFVAGKR